MRTALSTHDSSHGPAPAPGAMRNAALTLVLALATGCATRYAGPELAVADRYGASATSPDALSMRMRMRGPDAAGPVDTAVDPWWQGFGDRTLDRFVADVLQRNRQIDVAAMRLQRARLQRGFARNARLPVAEGSASRADSEQMRDGGPTRTSTDAQIAIGYEVDLWGRLRTAEEAAAWAARASAEDARSVALTLISTACDQYFRLGDLNARIAHGERSLALARRTRALVDAQYRAGAVSGLEVGESEQSLQRRSNAQALLLQQREELRRSIAVLRDGLAWPEADEPQNAEAAPLPLDPGLPTDLLARRPDLRAAEARLRQTFADAEATRRDLYPRLTLTLGASASGSGLEDLIDRPVRTLTRSLLLPFLDANGARLRVADARLEFDIADTEFGHTLIAALGEVETALSARSYLAARAASARDALAAADAVEKRYGIRYRAGSAPLRLWLEAQQSRDTALSSVSEAELALRRNDIALALALGGSGRTEAIDRPPAASPDGG